MAKINKTNWTRPLILDDSKTPMTKEEAEKLWDKTVELIREESYADEQGYFSKVTRLEKEIESFKKKFIEALTGKEEI